MSKSSPLITDSYKTCLIFGGESEIKDFRILKMTSLPRSLAIYTNDANWIQIYSFSVKGISFEIQIMRIVTEELMLLSTSLSYSTFIVRTNYTIY
jgi:hypothetical protein